MYVLEIYRDYMLLLFYVNLSSILLDISIQTNHIVWEYWISHVTIVLTAVFTCPDMSILVLGK